MTDKLTYQSMTDWQIHMNHPQPFPVRDELESLWYWSGSYLYHVYNSHNISTTLPGFNFLIVFQCLRGHKPCPPSTKALEWI